MTLKPTYIALLIGFSMLCIPSGHCAQKSSKKTKSEVTATEKSARPLNDESGVNALLSALSSAASIQDAQKMAALWTSDGLYVDTDGTETRGRQALAEKFAAAQAGLPKASIVLHPSTVKFPGLEAAWVEGTATRQTSTGTEPSARFSMLLQKQSGTWLISSATETLIASKSTTDQLDKLSWLLGEWTAQQGAAKVKLTADWTGNKSFILCKYLVNKAGEPDKTDTQIIGWDPSKEQIVSWHFDDNGGFGYGSWSKRGKQWVISTEGVEQSGSRTAALNILSIEDQNKFSWQSVNRVIDGTTVPDTDPLTVQRTQKVSSRSDENKI